MLNSLSDIEAFIRVAETLNFTRAAAELHVTPTAVSKAVARLENEINAKLFIRTTRQVQLTAEGELFRDRCVAAFAEISAGLEGIEVLRDQTTGPVRLSAPFILGRRLAASLPDLMGRHANLDLRLFLTDDYVDLAEDRIDIAIRIGAG
ncbi:MAG: LysR family transcriptional regulator, partial [Chloroflexota bacterium]